MMLNKRKIKYKDLILRINNFKVQVNGHGAQMRKDVITNKIHINTVHNRITLMVKKFHWIYIVMIKIINDFFLISINKYKIKNYKNDNKD